MSSNDPDDESADSQQESEQQPTDSDQPAAQSDEQPAEQNDQSTEQSEEQPTDSDQQIEQSEEPATAADQATELGEQPAESDHAAEQSGDATGGGGGGGPADDAVAADSSSAPKGNLKVTAKFTQENQKFIGDIQISVNEYNDKGVGRKIYDMDWQDALKGNIIATPIPRPVTKEFVIKAYARALLPTGDYQMMDGQYMYDTPNGNALQTEFRVMVTTWTAMVNAPDAEKAKGAFYRTLPGRAVDILKIEPIAKQQFRITGRYPIGSISSPDGTPVP